MRVAKKTVKKAKPVGKSAAGKVKGGVSSSVKFKY